MDDLMSGIDTASNTNSSAGSSDTGTSYGNSGYSQEKPSGGTQGSYNSGGYYGSGMYAEDPAPALDSSSFSMESTRSDDSQLLPLLKGILGAAIGALPGMLLWIILGKVGFVASACGLLLALGVVFGYTLMTKDSGLSAGCAVLTCLIIAVLAIYMAERIVWTWEIADMFKTFAADVRTELYSLYPDLSTSEIDSLVSDKEINSYIREEFGFTEGTFSECFFHFGTLLDKLEVKSDFTGSLMKSYLYAALGGAAYFTKFAKKQI